jgi:4-amino-4-deoxy-L-arabinose transferase-like glycosyltransferase
VTPLEFAAGLAALGGMVVPTVVAARSARRRWWSAVDGPVARLIDVVLVLGQLYLVAYALGSVGWFHRWAVVTACTVLGAAIHLVAGRPTIPGRRPEPSDDPDRARSVDTALAAVAVLVVTVRYLAHTVVSLHHGSYDGDSLWYHAPFAARFVQEGSITGLHFTGGERLVSYYPANSELAGALSILPFHRDLLLPILNLGWAALALLAAWCIGDRYLRGELGLASVALALTVPAMASTQGGSAANDVAGVALLLTAVALLVRADGAPRWFALSGLAAGLAFGVKFSLVPPVAVLAVVALLLAPRRRRIRAIGAWGAAFALPALYWLVRNWVRAGNPVPWTSVHLGPIDFDAVPLPDSAVHASTILHYAGRPGAWSHVFWPGLRIAFGPMWPVTFTLAVGGAMLALWSGRDRAARSVAALGLAGLALYLVTPNAAGTRAMPFSFATTTFVLNSRYGAPALAIAFVALSTSSLVRRPRVATWATGLLTVLVIASQLPRELQNARPEWLVPSRDLAVAAAATAAAAGAALVFRRVGRSRVSVAAAIVATVAIAWPVQRVVADNRYQPLRDVPLSDAFAWAQEVTGSRIALSGDLRQYPFYGPRLDNHVQLVSFARPDGTFREPASCPSWRRALAEGAYDYVVIVPPSFGTNAGRDTEERWLAGDPGATPVSRTDAARIWRLRGPLDPAGCPRR